MKKIFVSLLLMITCLSSGWAAVREENYDKIREALEGRHSATPYEVARAIYAHFDVDQDAAVELANFFKANNVHAINRWGDLRRKKFTGNVPNDAMKGNAGKILAALNGKNSKNQMDVIRALKDNFVLSESLGNQELDSLAFEYLQEDYAEVNDRPPLQWKPGKGPSASQVAPPAPAPKPKPPAPAPKPKPSVPARKPSSSSLAPQPMDSRSNAEKIQAVASSTGLSANALDKAIEEFFVVDSDTAEDLGYEFMQKHISYLNDHPTLQWKPGKFVPPVAPPAPAPKPKPQVLKRVASIAAEPVPVARPASAVQVTPMQTLSGKQVDSAIEKAEKYIKRGQDEVKNPRQIAALMVNQFSDVSFRISSDNALKVVNAYLNHENWQYILIASLSRYTDQEEEEGEHYKYTEQTLKGWNANDENHVITYLRGCIQTNLKQISSYHNGDRARDLQGQFSAYLRSDTISRVTGVPLNQVQSDAIANRIIKVIISGPYEAWVATTMTELEAIRQASKTALAPKPKPPVAGPKPTSRLSSDQGVPPPPAPSSEGGREALLAQIQGEKKLKKTVTLDKSLPVIESRANPSGADVPTTAARAQKPKGGGDLMSELASKLKKRNPDPQ